MERSFEREKFLMQDDLLFFFGIMVWPMVARKELAEASEIEMER